jgi:hypothetical protein
MKKLVLILALMLAVGGCCAKTLDGVTTKSFSNCLESGPVNMICNPTPAQQATAAAMLAALDAAQVAGSIFLPALAIAKASAVLRVIQAGGCFLVAELKEAFIAVDAANRSQPLAKLKIVKGSGSVPEYAPLRVYVK